MNEKINPAILANIRGCKNSDPLRGVCCTINCPDRDTCQIARTKLTIPGAMINTDDIQQKEYQGIPILTIGIKSLTSGGHLNECTNMILGESHDHH